MIEIKGAGGKGGASTATTPKPPVNSLHSISYAKIVDVISEGEIKGLVDGSKSIYFDKVPLQNPDGTYNFEGVTVSSTVGAVNQAAITGFDAVQTEVSSGVEITHQTIAGKPGPAVVTLNPNIDKVQLKLGTNALYKTNRNTGRNLPFSIEFKIYIKKTTDSSWVNPFYDATVDITGTTTAAYERQVEISFDDRSATWMVKIERVTLDKEELEDEGSDQKRFDHKCSSFLNSYTEVTEARLNYPDTAYVATKIDASQFGSSIPSRAFLVDGIIVKVPTNYNPETRVYSGDWNGSFKLAWTNNPAWILRHLLTNTRYGCGIQEEFIDNAELYVIAKHCDEMVPSGLSDGSTEPRFTINTVLSTQEDVNTAISHITSVFAGMAFWDANTIRTVADYDSDPVTLVTRANTVDGEFNYTSSSIRERHSVALVTWNDPDSDYTPQVEIVEDRDSVEQFGWKTIDVTAFGCTSRGQAHRLGRRILYSERVETETISYSAGLDHYKVRPGDIIQVSDPSKDGARYGGRVLAVNGNSYTLDNADNTNVGDSIYLTSIYNKLKLHKVVSKVGRVITVDGIPEAVVGSIWQSIPSVLTNLPRYRVVSLTEGTDGTFGVTGVYHDPNKYKYIENNLTLPTVVVNKTNFNPAPPTGISHSESLEKNNNTITTCLYTSWSDTKVEGTATPTSWSVRYRKNGGNWEQSIVYTRTFILNNLSDDDTVEFHIRSRSISGKVSGTYAASTYSVLGKTIPPSQVTGFSSSVISNGGILLSWNQNPEIDIDRYEIYKTNTKLNKVFSGPETSYVVKSGELTSGQNLYIWAVDVLGNYSTVPAQLKVVYSTAATPIVSLSEDDSNDSNTFFLASWNDVEVANGFDLKNYSVTVTRNGQTIRSLKTKSTQYRFQVKQAGTYTVSVTAKDVFGQQTVAGSASKECSPPLQPTGLSVENKDNQLTLKWGESVRGALPVKGYLVSTSNTDWVGSSVIYNGSSTNKQITDLFTSTVNTVTLYVRSVDSAGNQSSSSSITYSSSSVSLVGQITKKISDTSKTVANIKYKWPAGSSPFGISKYEVTLSGAASDTAIVSSLEWSTNLTWIGETTLSVVAVDNKGNKSSPITHTFTSSLPNSIPSHTVTAVTATNGNITLLVDWSAATKGTLPIAGYEVRNSDVGFGSTGYVYKGIATQATITTPLSTLSTKSVYIRAFDTEGNYCSSSYVVALAVSVTPSVPSISSTSFDRNKLSVVYTQSISIGVPEYEVAIGDATNKTILYTGTDNPARVDIVTAVSANVYVRAKYNGNTSAWSSGVSVSYLVGSPTNFTATVHNKRKLKLNWTASSSSIGIDKYIVEAGDNPTVTKTVKGSVTNCEIEPEWVGQKNISIVAVDKAGVSSSATTIPFTIVAPSAITGTISSNIVKQSSATYTVTLDWENASEGTFAIDGYDIKTVNANWGLDYPALKRVKGSSAIIKTSSKAFTYYIRAFDKFGNYATSSVSLTKDGLLPATISPTSEVIGSNIKISWVTTGTDLDIKRFEIGYQGEGFRNLGDSSSITLPIKTTSTYTIRAVDYDERVKDYPYTVTIVQPSLTQPELTFLGATTVVTGTSTTPYHKVKVDFSVPLSTYAISSYTIKRKNKTGGQYTVVYEGNSNSIEVLAYHDITTDFIAYVTDVAGNKSAEITFSRDKVAPAKATSITLGISAKNTLSAGISYAAPRDVREYKFTFYKFVAGSSPLADGSNWETVKKVSNTIETTDQTCAYKVPVKWGGSLNATKAGIKYGVSVAIYDTSGNMSAYTYSTVKVIKS